jgi:hypothetical protein
MIAELMICAVGALAGGWIYTRSKRAKLYGDLTARAEKIAAADAFEFKTAPRYAVPRFDDRLAIVPDFLPEPLFAVLRTATVQLLGSERSFVPMHKKGGTIAYESLIAAAPSAVALYRSAGLQEFVSRVVGGRVDPTPINDQSSLSLLVYDRPGDHIGWHFDHNFYRGRHFTVLLAIENEGRSEGGLSHAALKAQAGAGEIDIRTPANTLVIFEGAKVRHKVTPILEGERRIILSMTYCADPRARWWQGASRRIKDTAFFGLRALWT